MTYINSRLSIYRASSVLAWAGSDEKARRLRKSSTLFFISWNTHSTASNN
jgi:hypothetical protein